jgi:hypothetical protein
MSTGAIDTIYQNGLMRTVYELTDSPETFLRLMELDGKKRMEVMSAARGKVVLSDIETVEEKIIKRLAKRKSLN